MPDELEKSGGDNQEMEGPAEERPTVSPPFDPAEFARDALNKPSPAAGMVAVKPDAHTHATPPHGTAQHAVVEMSRESNPPDLVKKAAILPDAPPDSLGSLAPKHFPSNDLPHIDVNVKRSESFSALNPLDREWAELELATRPPPADAPDEDPVIEVSSARDSLVDLDEVDSDFPTEEKPTTQAPKLSDIPEAALPTTAPVPVEALPTEREMNDRVSVGDYSGALEIAEWILGEDPSNSAAKSCADNCRVVLRKMYAARLGPLDRVPVVAVPRDQLRWLSIDHKAGFVLSLVDGVSSLEMIIDVSGMPELETLRILSELAQQRIISLK